MHIKITDKYEIHYIFDIPSVVLSVVRVLLNRKDDKAYMVIFGNPESLPKEKEER